MRTITVIFCSLLFAFIGIDKAAPQDSSKPPAAAKATESPIHYYHLQFDIQELGADGKPTNSRTYSTIVSAGDMSGVGMIRTGARVPIITGALNGQTGEGKLEYQYQYIDVGVHIDTRAVHEVGRQLGMHLDVEISRLADGTPTVSAEQQTDPVIRQNAWGATVLIPVDKPTVVFASDALENKGRIQVIVTAAELP